MSHKKKEQAQLMTKNRDTKKENTLIVINLNGKDRRLPLVLDNGAYLFRFSNGIISGQSLTAKDTYQ